LMNSFHLSTRGAFSAREINSGWTEGSSANEVFDLLANGSSAFA
jgi:hypothetical protein